MLIKAMCGYEYLWYNTFVVFIATNTFTVSLLFCMGVFLFMLQASNNTPARIKVMSGHYTVWLQISMRQYFHEFW